MCFKCKKLHENRKQVLENLKLVFVLSFTFCLFSTSPLPLTPNQNLPEIFRGKTESQQQQPPVPTNKFPVAAGLASTAHDAGNSLEKLPVGTMAGILRVRDTVLDEKRRDYSTRFFSSIDTVLQYRGDSVCEKYEKLTFLSIYKNKY